MKLNIDPKVREIRSMKVAEIVSLVNEINKPPGGIMTLNEIIIHAHISNKTKLLEIGSTTGYSSIQIKRLTGANVYGIDVNKTSVEYAKRNSEKEGVKVDFRVTDATNLPFKDESFDVIYASNVTSFINDKTSAINNYIRTLKTYGFLAVVPIYYIKHPPKSLLNTVSKEIGAEIKDFNRDYWTDLFNRANMELVYSKEFAFKHNSKDEIVEYINKYIMEKKEVKKATTAIKSAIFKKYLYQFSLFNKNLSYTRSSILIYRKVPNNYEKELFPYAIEMNK